MEARGRQLISQAESLGVSDIHLHPRSEDYQVFFRINGQLEPADTMDLDTGRRLITFFKFLADMDVGERRRPQSGSCQFDLAGQLVELRLSTLSNVDYLESLVIRILRQRSLGQDFLASYFPQDGLVLNQLLQRKSGLILFSGPVGSGKTTTIYQLLGQRARQEFLQVITMEDPVEIHDSRFLQTEVNPEAGISYDILIKSSLRHHPDILMIGEIRDSETARMVIRAALTGHLVIATIHAKNALGVIGRLQELQITDQQLSQTLIGIISQRLIPRYCPHCQGPCRTHCSVIPKPFKRLALLEILAGESLNQVWQGQLAPNFVNLNQKLRKAWAYGFIDTESYIKFEVL